MSRPGSTDTLIRSTGRSLFEAFQTHDQVTERLVQEQKKRPAINVCLDGMDCIEVDNGEGGIRTHEGVTPTRFRVVRNQPDSATSPIAQQR